jgi:hypothetical protein
VRQTECEKADGDGRHHGARRAAPRSPLTDALEHRFRAGALHVDLGRLLL